MLLVSGLERGRSSSKSVHGPADQKDRSSLISAQAHSSRRSNSSRRIQSVLRVDHFLSDSLGIIFVFRFSVRNCGSTKHFACRAREVGAQHRIDCRIIGDIGCLLSVFRGIPGIVERGLTLENAFRDRYAIKQKEEEEEEEGKSYNVC